MTRYRSSRIGELLQTEVADLLLRQLKDPRLRMATVSRVEVSADLRHACIYISHMGSEEEQKAALEGFRRAAGFIRGQLGRQLKLRYVPELVFKLDTAIAYGVRISRLLHELLPEAPQEPAESDSPHA